MISKPFLLIEEVIGLFIGLEEKPYWSKKRLTYAIISFKHCLEKTGYLVEDLDIRRNKGQIFSVKLHDVLDALIGKGYIQLSDEGYALTEKGMEEFSKLVHAKIGIDDIEKLKICRKSLDQFTEDGLRRYISRLLFTSYDK